MDKKVIVFIGGNLFVKQIYESGGIELNMGKGQNFVNKEKGHSIS